MTLKLTWGGIDWNIVRNHAEGDTRGFPAFHAALVAFSGHHGTEVHTHDFAEMMFVVSGAGCHIANGITSDLSASDLLFIRPHDRHAVRGAVGSRLVFINIAFPVAIWNEFAAVAGLEELVRGWDTAPQPPWRRLPEPHRERAASAFQNAIRVFHAEPTRFALCHFWSETLPLLAQPEPDSSDAAYPSTDTGTPIPPWLARTCLAMREQANLRLGLSRMLALSGVSAGHLSRTLALHYGKTPTEYINALRLDNAALLLSTTSAEILDISLDCGFDNLSYFYRLFRQRFGTTPAIYRARGGRTVAP